MYGTIERRKGEGSMKWESYSHPISDVRDWADNERLELRPDFQRNEVWTQAAQIMLIDTILKGIPIPKIYIKSIMKNEKTYRIVVDGQQRLTAILKFIRDELPLKKPYQGEYFNMKYSELPESVHDDFIRYKIDINEIFNPSDEEIRDLYSRVNKYTVQLNKQELRKADFPGDFISLAEKISENSFFESSKIFSVKQRRRMLDVEFIEELLTIILEGVQDKKDYLDNICEKYVILDNKEDIEQKFLEAIQDISIIFDPEVFPIQDTRFKQKSDFYSLFACVLQLKEKGELQIEKLEAIRSELRKMDENIGPQSDEDEYREYATRCLSDANSITNRNWRTEFMRKRVVVLYEG